MSAPLPLWASSLIAQHTQAVHGFTGRDGGVSQGAFRSLNLGTRVDDNRDAVLANRDRVLQALDRPHGAFVALKQVHSATVVQVTAQASPHIEADAMWTRDRGCVLAVLGADCLPMVIADKRGRAVGAAHAGWRGTQARIGAALVGRLKEVGIAPEDMVVALGPCIGPCCFAIGEDVASQLTEAFPTPRAPVLRDANGKNPRADLWELNTWALQEAGVPLEHIDVIRRCTLCSQDLFSHRGDKGVTGRQAGLIAL